MSDLKLNAAVLSAGCVLLLLSNRNVGLLRYYELKQLPNFALAAPMLAIAALGITDYARADPSRFFSLGFRAISGSRALGQSEALQPNSVYGGNARLLPHVYLWAFLAVFALLVMHVQVATRFLAGTPVLYWYLAACWCSTAEGFDGQQSAAPTPTRVVPGAQRLRSRGNGSPSPAPSAGSSRDVAARQRMDSAAAHDYELRGWRLLLVSYFVGYLVIGCALFSNYYPWT
jgi:hypothetical protein